MAAATSASATHLPIYTKSPIDSTSSSLYHTTTVRPSSFSMKLLKELRSASGAPIVECKKALQAMADEKPDLSGDDDETLQAALDWLRQHGAAKASSKVADRQSVEGLVSLAVDDNHQTAVLLKVASETDFASRSSTFVQLVEQVTHATLPQKDSTSHKDKAVVALSPSEIAECTLEDDNTPKTIQTLMDEAIVAIRENISVASVQQLFALPKDKGVWVGYVHNRVHESPVAGTAAAAVYVVPTDNNSTVTREDLIQAGKKLAMHVVAARPQYMTRDQVPADVVEKEEALLASQVTGNKPPDIAKKIVQGRMGKFYEQICLLDQGHMVEEKSPPVGKFLKERGMELKDYQAMFIS